MATPKWAHGVTMRSVLFIFILFMVGWLTGTGCSHRSPAVGPSASFSPSSKPPEEHGLVPSVEVPISHQQMEAELAVSPAKVGVGARFEIRLTVTNAGEADLRFADRQLLRRMYLSLTPHSAPTELGIERGVFLGIFKEYDHDAPRVVLPSGATWVESRTTSVNAPGIWEVRVYLQADGMEIKTLKSVVEVVEQKPIE